MRDTPSLWRNSQGPENVFPAASQDVATVYRHLLKTYKPSEIGIYGCSAGGLLTAESMACFIKEKLPLPAAIGVLCSVFIDRFTL